MAIVVLTTEPLPLPGQATTGAGLRAWGLATGLAARGASGVVIAAPNTAAPPDSSNTSHKDSDWFWRKEEAVTPGRPFEVRSFRRGALTEFVREVNPDVVVMQHWGLMRELHACACPLAIDLAGPHLLERRYWRSPDPNADLLEKIDALGRADFVVCSGAWQRHYFLPYLQMAGWDVTAPDVCPVIPFSFAPEWAPAPPTNRSLDTFVYGGVFLPWQDPEAGLRAALEAMDAAGRGRLLLYGGPHPQGDVSGGRFDGLLRDLSDHPRVAARGLASFDQILNEYAAAGVALRDEPLQIGQVRRVHFAQTSHQVRQFARLFRFAIDLVNRAILGNHCQHIIDEFAFWIEQFECQGSHRRCVNVATERSKNI